MMIKFIKKLLLLLSLVIVFIMWFFAYVGIENTVKISKNQVAVVNMPDYDKMMVEIQEHKKLMSFINMVEFINPKITLSDAKKLYYGAQNKIAPELGLDYLDIASICKTESDFNKNAISEAQSIGICQIHIGTYRLYAAKGLFKYEPSRLTEVSYNMMVMYEVLKEHKAEIDKIFASSTPEFKRKVLIASYNAYGWIGRMNENTKVAYVNKVENTKKHLKEAMQ